MVIFLGVAVLMVLVVLGIIGVVVGVSACWVVCDTVSKKIARSLRSRR